MVLPTALPNLPRLGDTPVRILVTRMVAWIIHKGIHGAAGGGDGKSR